MRRVQRDSTIKILALVLSIFHLNLGMAGTTGNLSGKVTDVSTGEELLGVNVLIVGSGRGGTTNTKGEFLVAGIAPGTYTLRVSAVGYKTIEARNIVIEVDETTVYNVRLASEDIELEGVTVEGKRPLIDVKKTASDQTFNRDKIDQLPNLKTVDDVLQLQAGVVKFGNQLFLRGGRANETQILIDGVVSNDVGGGGTAAGTSNANELLQQLYSGTATTGAGVSADAISSVSTSTSGLDAEFGNAQSGVVNITTKSGSETYSGSAQYRTDGLGGYRFDERYYALNFSGPEPITSYLLPAMGAEIPGKITFSMSGSFSQSNGPYSFSTGPFYNPVQRKVQFSGFFGKLLNNLGFNYSDKQSNDFAFNTKVTYNSGANDQVFYSYRANASSSRPMSSAFGWRDRYDSSASAVALQTQHVLQYKHFFSTNTELRAYLSRHEIAKNSTIGNLTPDKYSAVTNYRTAYYRDPNNDGFYDIGSAQGWSKSNTVIWNFKAAFESQVHQLHFLKTGLEFFGEHIQSTDISYPLAPERYINPNAAGEYPEYGLGRWVSDNVPARGGMWVQDNIDFPGINIKLGLRYDFFYVGKQVASRGFVKSYESVINDNDRNTAWKYADWVEYDGNPDPARLASDVDNTTFSSRSLINALTSGDFSPRLAISYPISERASFYFNYGHFLQYPERDQFFHAPFYDSTQNLTGNYIGNPSLKPQRTVQYEAGFKQLIFEDLSLQIVGYYKDIFDYVAFQRLQLSGRTVDRYVNLDYASSRGFEIIVEKGLSDHYSGSINYTFQLAKGRASDPFVVQASPQLFGLPRETRLDYDQRHTVNLFLGYRVRPGEDYEIFGIPFDNFSASVTWSFGSGFPYTPFNLGRTLEDLYLKNTGDGPYTSLLNISLSKGFQLVNTLNLLFTLDVTNVLNRRNVNLSAGGFNNVTGAPYVFGDSDPQGRRYIYPWAGAKGSESFESRVPPFVFGNPRQIIFGVRLAWN